MMRKGIILAGGHGTRLFPATQPVSKQLLPVYDKPMVYYPLTTLMLAGIRDILVICTPQEQQRFIDALGDGSQWGIRLQYAEQSVPAGIADALRIGREFLAGSPVVLILGDNIFFGHDLAAQLRRAAARGSGATVFAYQVSDPQRYGVIEFDADSRVISLEEKPLRPKSSFVVTGLYFYDNQAPDIAASLEPSARGELEITDLNQRYLDNGALEVQIMGHGYAWLDMGTPDSLLDAANFIATLQKRQGLMVACPEEVALRQQWITVEHVARQAHVLRQSQYGAYLQKLVGEFVGKGVSCS